MDGDGDGECTPRGVAAVAGGSCCSLFVLFLSSMAVVHPTEWGLRFNYINMAIAEEHTPPGRHIIGPWQTLIIYPATVRTIEFSNRGSGLATSLPLRTRTSEGLDLTIHLSFQYKLKNHSLPTLYTQYKQNYQNFFQRQAAAVLLSVASQYEAEKYWTARAEIGLSMLQGLRTLLQDSADIPELEIMIIELPSTFEEKIVATQEAKQIRHTREAEQQAAVIRAQIEVMLANFRKQQSIILNNATAESMLLTQTATAFAQASRLRVETDALEEVASRIPLSPAGQVSYQRGIAYQNVGNAQFMFGVQQAAAIVATGGSTAASPATVAMDPSGDAGVVPQTSQAARMLTENIEASLFRGTQPGAAKAA